MMSSSEIRILKDTLSHYKVSVISLGCPRNRVDSEIILGEFGRLGCELTQFPDDGDIIIVNTCSFIEDARVEAERVIKGIAGWDKSSSRVGADSRLPLLIVCGCLPQLMGAKLFDFLQVDAIVGVSDIHKLPSVAADLVNGEEKVVEISAPAFLYDSNFPRLISTPPSYKIKKVVGDYDIEI